MITWARLAIAAFTEYATRPYTMTTATSTGDLQPAANCARVATKSLIELRAQTRPSRNTQNRLPRKLGAYFDKNKKSRPWRAKIMVDGQCIELGHYETQAEAQAAYLAAKRELHPFYVSGIGRAA